MSQNENPIAGWIARQIEKGYQGFELYVREGAGLSLVERYSADRDVGEAIYAEAQDNAQGSESTSRFFVRALSDGSGPYPSRSFSIPAALPLHEPERFEERNSMRLLLEHIDKQNRVLTQVVPACLAAMGGMVQGLSAHFGTLAETHEKAIRTIRDGRLEQVEAERAMLADAARQARMDKLIDAGLAMLPQVIERLKEENEK